jgi:hypothetical protein
MCSSKNQIFAIRCICNDLKIILNYNISIMLATNILEHSNNHCNCDELKKIKHSNNSCNCDMIIKPFQLQYFNLVYNIFNPRLQYVLSTITICSYCGYNIFKPRLQSKTTILITDNGSAP